MSGSAITADHEFVPWPERIGQVFPKCAVTAVGKGSTHVYEQLGQDCLWFDPS